MVGYMRSPNEQDELRFEPLVVRVLLLYRIHWPCVLLSLHMSLLSCLRQIYMHSSVQKGRMTAAEYW